MIYKEFLDAKEKAFKSLEKACEEDKADGGILPILSIINDSCKYYTSSSCAGRIVLLEIPSIGDKRGAEFLEKWHRTIELDEFIISAKKAEKGLLWLLAQPPIIHIGTHTIDDADALVKMARSSGFKNSGIKSIRKKIIVELCSTERLDAPVGKDGALFCDEKYLRLLIDISNNVIEKSAVKLKTFEKKLRNI